jgi:hypothetical protein
MANMSYCRFHNTVRDLRDCREHLQEALPNRDKWDSEFAQRQKLVEECARLLQDWGFKVDERGTLRATERTEDQCMNDGFAEDEDE